MLPIQKLIELRHTLHAHPEVSGTERDTAALVESYLRPLKPDGLLTGVGGHGLIATFDSGQPGPALLFRSELDALPIVETNQFGHKSETPGVSHKCGHDGHTAILCGLAELLAAQRPAHGKVYLLFQPAEETGAGAEAVLRDPKFAKVKPDLGVALHNFPGVTRHVVIIRNGIFTAAVSSMVVHLLGRTAHASEPENGLSPALAVAELLRACDGLNLNDPSSPEFKLVTPVHVRVGSPAYGVAAGDGEVHLTLRSWDNTRLEMLRSTIAGLVEDICSQHRLQFRLEMLQKFHANYNDPQVADLVRQAAADENRTVVEADSPVKGGEDFGLFTECFPCCMFGLGAGEDTPALHSPDYDFPDEIIETGVRIFNRIVRKQIV